MDENESDGELGDVVWLLDIDIDIVLEVGSGVVLGENGVFVFGIGGGDVDTGEALEGREESGDNGGAHPAGGLVQLLS